MSPRLSKIALALLLLAALLVRYRGIDWPRFHPDEPTIAQWVDESAGDGVVRHYGYPSGFFNLFHPVRAFVLRAHAASADWHLWTGSADRVTDITVDNLALARHFNVWLGTLTVFVLYLLGRRVTGSSAGGLFAAALLAFAPYHVEHCHYGETDIAMLFTLILALWLWGEVLARDHLGWVLLASLATGVAVGTKYTVALLAVMPLIAAARAITLRPTRRTLVRALTVLSLSVLVVAIGYVWSNPGVLEWETFRAGLREGARRTYAERVGLLQDLRHVWWGPVLANARIGADSLLSLGPGWLLLLAPGVVLALRSPWRRYWPVTLLFPMLFGYYFLFVAPWVRSQEFMAFYPSFTVLAALPLAAALRRREDGRRAPVWMRALVLLLVLWTVTVNAQRGTRVAAIFQWQEPRIAAREWLRRHASADSHIGFERYAQFAIYDYPGQVADVFKIERNGLARIEAAGCDYVLRNASSQGRGTIDPRTRARYPNYQERFDEFMAGAEQLAQWGSLPPQPSMFAGCVLELYGVHREAVSTNLAVGLTRPALLSTSLHDTFYTPVRPLGSELCELVNTHSRTLAFGGPDAVLQPAYLVLTTEDRSARIHVRGFGRHQVVRLAPYDIAIVRLERPWWRPAWNSYEFVTVWAEAKRGIVHLPCYVRAAFTDADIIRFCNEQGRPDRAFELLGSERVAASADPVQSFIAAAEAGRTEVATALAPAAESACSVLASALQSNAAPVALDAIGPARYAEFARVRVESEPLAQFAVALPPREGSAPIEPVDWRIDATSVDATPLPLLMAAGRYELRFHLAAASPSNLLAGTTGPFEIRDLYGETLYRGDWSSFQTATPLTVSLNARYSTRQALKFVSASPARVDLSHATLQWQRQDLARSLHNRLVEALARHALDQGRPADARPWLARETGEPWNEAGRRTLAFRTEREAETIDYDGLRASARNLLEVAPQQYAARELLQATEAAHLYSTRHREAGDQEPLRFPPFANLVNATRTNDILRCVLEITRDDTPPLTLAVVRRHQSRWKDVVAKPVGARLLHQSGERIVVLLPLPKNVPMEDLGLGLRTQVKWSPGWLPVAGRDVDRVPLIDVLQRPADVLSAER